MAPDRIGFDRVLRREWLDQACLAAAELRDSEGLRAELMDRLKQAVKGDKARRNTTAALTRIWWRVPEAHVALRDAALLEVQGCDPDQRLLHHWGMLLLAYPLFGDSAATIGRLLRLQGTFRQAQLSRRIMAQWGHRSTLDTALPRIVRSMVDWEVLLDTGERGVYAAGQTIGLQNREPVLWLLAALLQSRQSAIPWSDLVRAPELFPFKMSISPADLATSDRFQLHQLGQEVMMVQLDDKNPGAQSQLQLPLRYAGDATAE